ncbi:MAG TPA: DNA polymerase III subunit delta [Chloroflexota bacterium]|nr:DNA polymerase III subunit delta [Chloroflexota bacterium]
MPIQLLFGDDDVAIDEALTTLRSRFDSADVISFDGASLAPGALAEACLTAGLFAAERLVIVRGLHERVRKGSDEAKVLEDIVGDVPPTTTLALVERGMAADHVITGWVRSASGEIRTLNLPRRNDIAAWIRRRAVALGAAIDPDAADLLGEMIGLDALALDSELRKLATYAAGERITTSIIETLVGAVPQDSIFTLVDAVAGGDVRQALHLLHQSLANASTDPMGFALYLIRMLARQMRILLRIRVGQESGRADRAISQDLRLPRYHSDRYFRQARRLSKERIVAAFEQLAALEGALKSGKAEPETGLDLLVTDLSSTAPEA